MPSKLIADCINELADVVEPDIFNRSAETSEFILKEAGYAC